MFKIIMRRCLKYLLVTAVSIVVLFAVLVNVARLTIPLLNHQRDFFERLASHLLHQPVHIGRVATSWYGFGPTLNFRNIVIVDPEHQKSLLQIDKLLIRLSPFHSLLHWRLLPGHLILSGTEIDVVETKEGRWHVKGMVLRKGGSADLGEIKNVILWLLKQPNIILKNIAINYYTPQRKLIPVDNLQVEVRNKILHHQIVGTGRLAQAIPTQFMFSLTSNYDDLRLYINVKNIVFKQWIDSHWVRAYARDFSIKHGKGDVQLWAKFHKGQLQSVQGLVSGHRLQLEVAQFRKAVAINQVHANLYWQQYADGWGLTGDHILLRMGRKEWPEHSFGVRVTHTKSLPTFFLQTDHFDLRNMSVLTESIGFWPQKIQTLYQKLQPQGQLQNLTVLYVPQASYYHITSDFTDLGFHAWKNLPSVSHVAGSIDISSSGKLASQSTHSTIAIPQIFRQPFALEQLQLAGNWRRNATRWDYYLKQPDTDDNELYREGRRMLRIPVECINLQGKFNAENAALTSAYLPYQHLDPKLLMWLRQAFLVGAVISGTLDLKEPLNKFSFVHGGGRFDVIANVNHVSLHYHSDWPDIQNIRAKLSFHNNEMCIVADHGEILGNPVNYLKAMIPNLKKPILTVIGHSASDLGNGFRFLQATPLLISDRIKNMVLRGPMNFNLKLTIPLLKRAKREIIAGGDLTVEKSQLNLKNWGITLDNIQGNFHFLNQNLSSDQVRAEWLGLPMTVRIATINPFGSSPTLQLEMSGQVTMQALQNQFHWSILNHLSGSIAYRALLKLHNDHNKAEDSLSIVTNLIGIKSTLPLPYNKPAQESAILNSTVTFANERLASIKMRYSGRFADADTSLNLFLTNGGWSVDIQNPLIVGNLFVSNNRRQQWQWQGHFSRIYLPKTKEKKQEIDLQEWPSLDISIDDFRYGRRSVGKVELQTTKTKIGLKINKLNVSAPLFYVKALGLWGYRTDESKTTLSGQFISHNLGALLKQWGLTHALEGGEGRADFSLRWPGSPNQFEAAHLDGHVKASFRNGRMTELGKSAESELGFGRVLNLLSLQSLPKLPLTLVNLTKKGFAFNLFQGDFSLMNGIAKTKNTSLVGDVAWAQVKGLIDFVKKNYDLHLEIVPNITSSLPLIIGIAGGPFAGIIAWIANQVLAPQVGRAARVNYHIAGPWNNLVVTLPPSVRTRLSIHYSQSPVITPSHPSSHDQVAG